MGRVITWAESELLQVLIWSPTRRQESQWTPLWKEGKGMARAPSAGRLSYGHWEETQRTFRMFPNERGPPPSPSNLVPKQCSPGCLLCTRSSILSGAQADRKPFTDLSAVPWLNLHRTKQTLGSLLYWDSWALIQTYWITVSFGGPNALELGILSAVNNAFYR